jgi:hypothetical protein
VYSIFDKDAHQFPFHDGTVERYSDELFEFSM